MNTVKQTLSWVIPGIILTALFGLAGIPYRTTVLNGTVVNPGPMTPVPMAGTLLVETTEGKVVRALLAPSIDVVVGDKVEILQNDMVFGHTRYEFRRFVERVGSDDS